MKINYSACISGVLVLVAITITACEKRPKQEVHTPGEREAVTQFGKAVEHANLLSDSADNRNDELTAQLDAAIEE